MQHWRKRELNTEVYYELSLRECYITLEPRVHYCDRGNWWAKVTCAGHPTNPNPLDAQDGWPRFYMSLERAKIEIVEWAIKRRYHTIINKTKQ